MERRLNHNFSFNSNIGFLVYFPYVISTGVMIFQSELFVVSLMADFETIALWDIFIRFWDKGGPAEMPVKYGESPAASLFLTQLNGCGRVNPLKKHGMLMAGRIWLASHFLWGMRGFDVFFDPGVVEVLRADAGGLTKKWTSH